MQAYHKALESIEVFQDALMKEKYCADEQLTTALYLAIKIQKPLFLEGEAGVGKTEIAKVLSRLLKKPLIRLQCYEGLDVSNAVYEWNFPRQIIEINRAKTSSENTTACKEELFSEKFLIERPLLQAIKNNSENAPILLIDEIDRADEAFEAFLLEILSDFQVTIPEIGTIKADKKPIVIITSNRTREVHDALKRRCLYHWVDYPSFEQEKKIINIKVSDLSEHITNKVISFVQNIRASELYKAPGISETLDWAEALKALSVKELNEKQVHQTIGVLLKYQDDIAKINNEKITMILDQCH